MQTPACPECGGPIGRIIAEVNPRTIGYDHIADCGHIIDRDLAVDLWKRGYRWTVPLVDAAALATAERVRQVVEEGYTPAHDAEHTTGLAWAAWSYVDRAMNPQPTPDTPPTAWPWGPEAWNADAPPLRRLVIAAGLLLAEIDRRLVEERSAVNREAST